MMNRSGQSVVAGDCGCATPRERGARYCYCTVGDLTKAISGKYSLAVINLLGVRERARFGEIAAALTGISTSTLAEHLERLIEVGLVDRAVSGGAPTGFAYELTGAGKTFRRQFHGILQHVRHRAGSSP